MSSQLLAATGNTHAIQYGAAAFVLCFVITTIGCLLSLCFLLPIKAKMFEHRKLKLIIVMLIGCSIELFSVIMNLTKFFWFDIIDSDQMILGAILKLTGITGWILVFCAFVSRAFLLLYQHKHNEFMSNEFWRILLNKDSFDNCFWVKNINTFGNERWLSKFVTFVAVSYILFAFGVATYLQRYHNQIKHKIRPSVMLMVVFALISLFVTRQIWINLPEKLDAFGIRDELKYTMISLLFPCFGIAFTVVFGRWVFHSPYYAMNIGIIIHFWNAIGCFIVICFSVFWVVRRFLIQKINQHENGCIAPTDLQQLPFTKCMKTTTNYEAFMHFLNEHFAVSRFLFLTEYSQFKKSLIINNVELAEFLGINNMTFELDLPSTLPLSNFVMNYNEIALPTERTESAYYSEVFIVFMKQSIGLFKKYLSIDAIHPVRNFSDEVRKQIIDIMQEYMALQYIHVSKADAFAKCANLCSLFEKSAFLISLQLNRRFYVFCTLKKVANSKKNKCKKRNRSNSRSRSRSKSLSPTLLQIDESDRVL